MTVRVAAIVPARNEAARIAETVRALRAVAAIDEVIVVDDASGDGTFRVAARAGAHAYRLRARRGKGGALAFGVARTHARVLVFCDGDLGDSAVVAGPLLEPVLAGVADMAVARPPDGPATGFGLVEGFSRWGIRSLAGTEMRRPLSGQRALRREIVDRFGIAPGFGVETALSVDALRGGFRVIEVPHPVKHRRTGRDLAGFAHRARQGLDVAAALAARLGRDHR